MTKAEIIKRIHERTTAWGYEDEPEADDLCLREILDLLFVEGLAAPLKDWIQYRFPEREQ
jgi:hypothetical protein